MAKNKPMDERDDESEPESELPREHLVRLNKFMAELGVASRRKCDELIESGKVTVDGEPAVTLGTKIDPERQVVDVNGVILKPLGVRKRYYLLNKPRRVVCTNEPREQRTRAIDLITDRNKGRIFSVGRLDEDSSGLILLTNDGEFTNQIAHPRHSVPKTYLVKVRGRIDEAALAQITEGVRLSEGKTSKAAIHVERRSNEASVLTITIREGKNREIRRVFAAKGYKVLRLHRVRIGALSDRRLKDGEWRPLTPEEVADLLDIANNRERAEELFARAAAGSFVPKHGQANEDGRPERESSRRDSRGREHDAERPERRSRFGGVRREWHEPKDFRIKSVTRKPRIDPAATRDGGESEPARGGAGDRGQRGARPSFGRDADHGGARPERRGARPDRGGASRERPDRAERGGRGDRPDRGRGERGERSDRSQSSGRPYRPKVGGRPVRSRTSGRGDRPEAEGRRERSKSAPFSGPRPKRTRPGAKR